MTTEKPDFKRLKIRNYFYTSFLLFISGFLSFFNLGKSSLENWDEAIYANIVAEMGSFPNLVTTCFSNIWVEKPPFGFWLHHLGTTIFGLNNFGLRVMPSLFFVGSVLMIYFLLKRFYSTTISFFISFAFSICPLFYFQHFTRTADLETYFIFFTILAIYFYVLSWHKSKWMWLSGLTVGAAFMTRGYSALLIFFVIFIHWLWLRLKEGGTGSKIMHFIVPFVLVILPWHVYMLIFYHSEFINSYLSYHFWQRITMPIEGHNGDALYYFWFSLKRLSFFTWIFLVSILYSTFLFFKTKKKEDLLWLLWFWLFLLPIQIIETKLRWYMIGLIPPLFFILASTANDLMVRLKKHMHILVIVFTVMFLAYVYLFLQNSIPYVLKPTILPVDILSNYLQTRNDNPDVILVYSENGDYSGYAAKFQWVVVDKYDIKWVDNTSDFQKNIDDDKSFVLLSDSYKYTEIIQNMPENIQYRIIFMDNVKNGWGYIHQPVLVISQ